jgi:hypothetical protein
MATLSGKARIDCRGEDYRHRRLRDLEHAPLAASARSLAGVSFALRVGVAATRRRRSGAKHNGSRRRQFQSDDRPHRVAQDGDSTAKPFQDQLAHYLNAILKRETGRV